MAHSLRSKSLVGLLALTVFSTISLQLGYAQGQLDVGLPEIWFQAPTYTAHPANPSFKTQDLVGNHLILPNDTVEHVFGEIAKLPKSDLSIFLVVKPRTDQVHGKVYLNFRGLRITDEDIRFRGQGEEFSIKNKRPLILSGSYKALELSGGIAQAGLIDTSLFYLAEVIAYNRRLKKNEMRAVESYLSLKYSIPTTRNRDKKLRSYVGDSANQYYWLPKRDREFDREVIALGHFKLSGLQQSQTVAYHNDSLIAALDTIVPFGQMSPALAAEGSKLVLSKRLNYSELYDCERAMNQAFPITAWSIRPHQWTSTASNLQLRYPKHHLHAFNDTIILTSGYDTIPIQVSQIGQDLAVSIPLQFLKNNKHYRFRVKSNQCDDSTGLVRQSRNDFNFKLNTPKEALPLRMNISHLGESLSWDTLVTSTPILIGLRNGQYGISLWDEGGEKFHINYLVTDTSKSKSRVAFGNTTLIHDRELVAGMTERSPRVIAYPVPLKVYEAVEFTFENFLSQAVKVQVFDAQGKLCLRGDIKIGAADAKWSYRPDYHGLYTFVFNSLENVHIEKIIVNQ